MDDSAAGRVLIAGGGIAGLAMRRALQRQGIPSLTLERRPTPADAGLAINLPGNAVQALGQFGLSEALRNIGSPVRRREYRTESGRLLFGIDEAAFWREEACPRCVRRADLLRLLTLDLPPTDLRPGCEISAVRQMPRGVAVELQDGTAETGGFLVGADGVHSRVRSDTFGASALGAAMLAPASWRFMAPNPGLDAWTLWAGSNGLFLLIPVDHGEVYGWVSVPEAGERARDLAGFRTVFASFPRLVRDTLDAVLAQPGALYHSPLEEVRIPSWTRNLVALVGDAAHATAPVWAQGAALALEDAVVLATLLAERMDWDMVGLEYEALRRPRVAHVQAMTDRLSRTARMPAWARNLLLPLVGPRSYRATYSPLRTPVSALASG
ncbi:NAD(P)/FAD-dependent oxidoreductase [Methylobacterium sp. WL120]|uniref:FAD-dependent monooxygenase n=1 Tax=Methylobacterium sp. WL120 TaxID=2603887 RepID=UPI0011C7B24F|nr:NAD(P)/FAD-dependent oxidoreductase [Methylobacterium sp. WL120]TXM70871.1 FAD-dependent monooxygenase [Methylobacterium sp. WL120]